MPADAPETLGRRGFGVPAPTPCCYWIADIMLVAALLAGGVLTGANAVLYAKGTNRVGCADPNGALVVRKPEPAAVVMVPKSHNAEASRSAAEWARD